jgi:cell wall-associated NlpC family hydrolase
MDRRLTPANGRVAHAALRGRVAAERFVEGRAARLAVPLADLCAAAEGARDRQLLLGAAVTVLEERDGWAFVQAAADGYVGWLPAAALGEGPAPTHRVAAAATHLYPAPDLKRRERARLSLGAALAVTGAEGAFLETPQGWVPAVHLRPLEAPEADPVAVAERLLGTPYLWGGNSRDGIDCSGLVQAALFACGRPCPGDSDLQEAGLGTTLPPGAELVRGDLVFWKGHVGWMADAATLLHANAHHMAVAAEPLAGAAARIAAAGGGDWRARRL